MHAGVSTPLEPITLEFGGRAGLTSFPYDVFADAPHDHGAVVLDERGRSQYASSQHCQERSNQAVPQTVQEPTDRCFAGPDQTLAATGTSQNNPPTLHPYIKAPVALLSPQQTTSPQLPSTQRPIPSHNNNCNQQPGAMSTSSQYHIPFPTNFLSLNTPVKRSGDVPSSTITNSELSSAAVAQLPEQPAHGFLSNRPDGMARHQSVSSVASVSTATDSVGGSPPSLPAKDARSPSVGETTFTPLALNSHHAPLPPSSHRALGERGVKSWFLTNRR
ncbi:hypothetical protein OPT61_g5196 [Boeremia exigua]|uniref:Uncharacterized protein n=1 Tax=Boeremia exigua TaxID=749465 RepID=A0ACC2IBA6_9PLEO|nr:hypothetical protein OPT61_g5196 [Boeremia exigua]